MERLQHARDATLPGAHQGRYRQSGPANQLPSLPPRPLAVRPQRPDRRLPRAASGAAAGGRPSLFNDITGSTDSELLFHLALTFGLEHDPPAAMEQAVGFIESQALKRGVETRSRGLSGSATANAFGRSGIPRSTPRARSIPVGRLERDARVDHARHRGRRVDSSAVSAPLGARLLVARA
jgi:hypothetical protein